MLSLFIILKILIIVKGKVIIIDKVTQTDYNISYFERKSVMTEQEIQDILENMSLEELKTLKQNYSEYAKEVQMIDRLKENLRKFQLDRKKVYRHTQKEKEIKSLISQLKNLPRKRKHTVEGFLNDNHSIASLTVDNQPINKSALGKRKYRKIFFGKSNKSLKIAIILFIIGLILLGLGLSLDMILLTISSLATLFVGFVNAYNYVFDDSLNKTATKYVSQRQINSLIKKLEKDYEYEKSYSENSHLENLLFLESKEDIFNKMLEVHSANLDEISSTIRQIIASNIEDTTLTTEELDDAQTLIQMGNQKILKNSHY